MTHETAKPHDNPLDAEYRQLMKLARDEGCRCGIRGCPGHELIGGKIFVENHPLGVIIVECPDKD